MRVIPAIDIIDGKCVRLTQGNYAQKKVYNENPLEVAKSFEEAGLRYLHLVDLDGARAGKVTNWKTIEAITSNTGLLVDFGGGIKTETEITRLFALNVKQINLGSISVKQPEMVCDWLHEYGAGKIIVSADVKKEKVQISGWEENSDLNIFDFLRTFEQRGLRYVTCTDISTDGMLAGPNLSLYSKLVTRLPLIKWIASGGVSSIKDIHALKKTGVDGVIVGKAIYENKILLSDLKNSENGFE
jgi:phosphoribosylformimino-5-aminoimidazole carboxamide ribotide isomerase